MILKNMLFAFSMATSLLFCRCSDTSAPADYLSVRETRFTDSEGRTVILNGINHVNKNPKEGYLHKNDEELFRQFRAWGFNCIRFGINWDGLEPEPGKINEAYLKEIDKRVKWAEENGLWLILDMHQDLYGRKYGNGAPLWATLDEDLPHKTGDVWSDAYLISPAIQKAFDNFWKNSPAPDGIGIQDHYIFLWKTLAKRYANSPSVAGFDIMNEPFMGSDGMKVFPKLLEGYARVIAQKTGKVPSEQEMADMWGNEPKRVEALGFLNNKTDYGTIVDGAFEPVRVFEEGSLTTFYQRVRDAVREVNKKQILFLEHTYFCNLGISSSFHIPLDKYGNKDSLCAYAPHGYDLVTDTKGVSNPGYERVELIFDRIFKAGKQKGVPLIVDEWGAFYMGDNLYVDPARHLIGLFEKNLAGQTYWSYWEKIETQDYFKNTLVRRAVQGSAFSELAEQMTGPLIYSISKDPVAAAKVLNDFAKTNDKLILKAGCYSGKLLDKAGVQSLASIPSREELLAKLLGIMQAPVSGFAVALGALAKQREEVAAA